MGQSYLNDHEIGFIVQYFSYPALVKFGQREKIILDEEMVRKCCILHCKGNYNDKNKTKIFRLPSSKNNVEEREQWIRAIPYKISVSRHTSVCENHWPSGYATVSVNGKFRPRDPLSVFQDVPKSVLPAPPSKPRSTKRTSLIIRNMQPDELDEFQEEDKINLNSISETISTKKFYSPVVCYEVDGTIHIQSCIFFSNGIPLFLIKINSDHTYTAFNAGVQCIISTLSKNRINLMDNFSKLEEAIRFLTTLPIDEKKNVMKEHLDSMGQHKIGEKVYSNDTIIRAFQYYATSRACYERLRKDYMLPSQRTLRNITSKVGKINEEKFVSNILSKLNDNQRLCNILVDEVYVKPSLQYHGGHLFGRAKNNPDMLASTVLAIMIKCLHGGPNFLLKMIPVAKMTAQFLYEQVTAVIDLISSLHGTVISVITDNNRTNQAFFKLFPTVEDKPWLTQDGIFLLFDYVHLIKSVRNNWITETTQELEFKHRKSVARWKDLIDLFELEKDNVAKLSSLTQVAVYPKPIERQKMSTCLKVFNHKTSAAL